MLQKILMIQLDNLRLLRIHRHVREDIVQSTIGAVMPDLSPTQRRVLEAASRQPKPDIREHMLDIKSPVIRDKVLQSMLKHGLVLEDPDADGIVYIVSAAGFAAINAPAAAPTTKTRKKKPAPEQPARNSKKNIIMGLLRGGATLSQIMGATGWQKHSVHGALANLKTQDGIGIASTKADSGERIYKIV
jgi:hypothetical protein